MEVVIIENFVGKRFNSLIVLRYVRSSERPDNARKQSKHWLCRSDYGDLIYASNSDLIHGHVTGRGHNHRKIKSLVGCRFGRLVVLSRSKNRISSNGDTNVYWTCRCDCGNIINVRATNLRYGTTRSCGCLRSISNLGKHLKDLTGLTFGRWHVLGYGKRKKKPSGRYVIYWRCQCQCGTKRLVSRSSLLSGESLSCGCLKLDKLNEFSTNSSVMSKMESVVFDYLYSRFKSEFVYQKYFVDLRGRRGYPLSYDFGFCYNNKYFLIECQGRQHYHSIEYFGGINRFRTQLQNDEIKVQYAFKRGFNLICLPWILSQDQIITILNDYII